MAAKRKKGGGFLRGIFYGLFVSTVIFLGLCVVFPLVETAPVATMVDPVQTAPQAFDVGPGSTDDSGVAMGITADSSPNVNLGAGLTTGAPVDQPIVETQSAAVPDIGNGANAPAEVAPVITAAPEPVSVAPQPVAVENNETVPSLPDAASGEAFEVFAVPFARDPSLPMLAIVFEDTLEANLTTLFAAGIPLNFAVSVSNVDPQISQGFRETGYEVLVLLPDNLPIDDNLSTSINSFIQAVPASIAVIDNSRNGIMRQNSAAQTMIETAAVNGMGTIAFSGAGDINARNLSRFYGKPFGSVHRVIDETADIAAIKNALDRATLTAQTSGSAIVYARTRDLTIQALLEWLGGARAERVQIVPVSQVMRPN